MIRLFRPHTTSCLSVTFADIGLHPDLSLIRPTQADLDRILAHVQFSYYDWIVLSATDVKNNSHVFYEIAE